MTIVVNVREAKSRLSRLIARAEADEELDRRRMTRLIWVVTLCGLAGCTDCSLNGGWERMVNPFCVDSARVEVGTVVADQRQPCSAPGTQRDAG